MTALRRLFRSLYPPMTCLYDVRVYARKAALFGLLFVLLEIIKLAVMLAAVSYPSLDDYFANPDIVNALIRTTGYSLFCLILIWRISSGRGHVSACALLMFVSIVLGGQMVDSPDFSSILLWFGMTTFLVNGCRATLRYREFADQAKPEHVFS